MANYIVHKAVEVEALSMRLRESDSARRWIISPKYDGCHVIFTFAEGKHLATYSRSGEAVLSMDHIAEQLLDLYPLADNKRIAICGEAWMLGTGFNEISGAFRRHSPQPQLGFVPFDVVPFDYADDTFSGPPILLGQLDNAPYMETYANRLSQLLSRRGTIPSNVYAPRWLAVHGTLAQALKEATAYSLTCKDSTTAHYDGAVLARADGLYKVGAGKGGEFIKVKPLLSHSVKVTAVISDVGVKTQKRTCVLCFDFAGAIQKVSTGLTQEQADAFTADPSVIIDRWIEVEAMGITVNGLLREPRFKGIREDV